MVNQRPTLIGVESGPHRRRRPVSSLRLFRSTFSCSSSMVGLSTRWSTSGIVLPRSNPSRQPRTSEVLRSIGISVASSNTCNSSCQFSIGGFTLYLLHASNVSSADESLWNRRGLGCNLFMPIPLSLCPRHRAVGRCWSAR